ncbi:hypothetical protein EMPS_00062 [Entomortierella parvispora]|uniref:Uncharacterized protein n=1 Tax=Entomortierella parvispora TaxID=205924 RepID=A0A9P3GZ39_9FUNG|nr:hypothetical protein EMPS_00062 [Entomortierella parvispora]
MKTFGILTIFATVILLQATAATVPMAALGIKRAAPQDTIADGTQLLKRAEASSTGLSCLRSSSNLSQINCQFGGEGDCATIGCRCGSNIPLPCQCDNAGGAACTYQCSRDLLCQKPYCFCKQ